MYCFAHGRESFFILFLLAGKMFTRLRSNNKYVCARIVSSDTENGSKHRIILCFNEFTLVINELALLTNIYTISMCGVYTIIRCISYKRTVCTWIRWKPSVSVSSRNSVRHSVAFSWLHGAIRLRICLDHLLPKRILKHTARNHAALTSL